MVQRLIVRRQNEWKRHEKAETIELCYSLVDLCRQASVVN